jgi:nucleotide-binding universal stress UspA family protein
VYSRILVVLQENGEDEAIVAHVQSLATLHAARVTLLRVIPISGDGGDSLGHLLQTEIGSSGWRRKQRARAYLGRLERRLQLQGCRVETAVVTGTHSEAEAIVRYADESCSDLVAMPADTRPWLVRALAGNTASRVQRSATVPTLFMHSGLRKALHAGTVANPHPMMAVLGSASL